MTTATIDRPQPLTDATYRRPRSPAAEQFGIPAALAFEPSITAEVVHDFRNTLAAVSMLSELMVAEFRQFEQESPLREIAREVRRGCADALELCDHLLPKSGSAPPASRHVQLADLCGNSTPARWAAS